MSTKFEPTAGSNVVALRASVTLTAQNANGTVAQIYAEVRKTRVITQVSTEICIHR
jgi:hypothetical protein